MRRRPLSLTLRVALLLAATAISTFIGVGAYLYHTLARQMSYRDDVELISKIVQVRQLLGELPSPQAMTGTAQPLFDALLNRDNFVLRVSGKDGAPLLRLARASVPLPTIASVPAQRAPVLGDIHDWTPAEGSGRLISAEGMLGTQTIWITLARESSDRLKVLQRYLADLLTALCLGALLATLLGYVIVRHSMRQLRSVISKANDINTSRLNARLSLQDAPIELRDMGEAFNAMLERLEDGVQRLSGFAADLAHDLRTPINTLMLETQVALARPRTVDEYQALMASNAEEYERMARMIDNTLFLARADNAQLALKRDSLDVSNELLRIHAYFDILAEDVGVQLRMDVTTDSTPLQANIDAVLLQRAMGNLVSNAIRHTPPGGTVTLSARRMEQGIKQGVELAVSNTGAAIAAEHLPHIFERYYRADTARSDAGHSAGLGLAIVRAIMALHGGTVAVRSGQDNVTTFSLLFPA